MFNGKQRIFVNEILRWGESREHNLTMLRDVAELDLETKGEWVCLWPITGWCKTTIRLLLQYCWKCMARFQSSVPSRHMVRFSFLHFISSVAWRRRNTLRRNSLKVPDSSLHRGEKPCKSTGLPRGSQRALWCAPNSTDPGWLHIYFVSTQKCLLRRPSKAGNLSSGSPLSSN